MTSTPEERIEKGIYDEAVDPYITEDMKQRAAAVVARAKIKNRPDVRDFGDAETCVQKEFGEMIETEDALVLQALSVAINNELQTRELREG